MGRSWETHRPRSPFAPGKQYMSTVKAQGYNDGPQSVEVSSRSVSPVKIDLSEAKGTLSVSSEPTGATVKVAGEIWACDSHRDAA
jgi:hypothetical protein